MMASSVKVTKDISAFVLRNIQRMADERVLIGFPSTGAARKDGPVGNAYLGFIHEHGAPKANIPARPFLVPGVRASLPRALKALKVYGAKSMTDPSQLEKGLEAAGAIARDSAKKTITSQGTAGDPATPFAPLSPVTLAARKRAKVKGTRALIRTGSMTNSITYIVKKGK